MTSNKYNPDQVQRCLDVLEQLRTSGLSTQDFAQTQGMSYGQLRAWQSHAPRWRAQLADPTYVAPVRRKPTRATRFIQVKVASAPQPALPANLATQAGVSPSVRIDCSQGERRVVLHWPSEAPVQCAQWLKAYLA
jgi:hypothetical protein